MFYDINNNKIFIAECLHCHKQVGVPVEMFDKYHLPDVARDNDDCCDNPEYNWIVNGQPNNFSDP